MWLLYVGFILFFACVFCSLFYLYNMVFMFVFYTCMYLYVVGPKCDRAPVVWAMKDSLTHQSWLSRSGNWLHICFFVCPLLVLFLLHIGFYCFHTPSQKICMFFLCMHLFSCCWFELFESKYDMVN